MIRPRSWFAPVLVVLALVAAAGARADGVRVSVQPETLTVAPGDTFTVNLVVPDSGAAFNGYVATLAYDPLALQFVQQPQQVQESPWLRGVCNNTFYVFNAAADSLRCTDILMCNGGVLSGPGTLLTLQFVATGAPQLTYIRLRRCTFYNDGLYVRPVTASDAAVAIGGALAVPPPSPAKPPRSLRAEPNPSRGAVSLVVDGAWGAAGGEALVVDVAGRVVRRLSGTATATRRISWDGLDADGQLLPAGVYTVLLRDREGTLRTTLVRLH